MMFSFEELARLKDVLGSARKREVCENKRHHIDLLRICTACDRVLCGDCEANGCQCERNG